MLIRKRVPNISQVQHKSRQGAFALGLADDPSLAAWRTPLSGRVTREDGGWTRESARVRRDFEALFTPCGP